MQGFSQLRRKLLGPGFGMLFFILVWQPSCQFFSADPMPEPESPEYRKLELDEYAVYSSIIRDYHQRPTGPIAVVMAPTWPYSNWRLKDEPHYSIELPNELKPKGKNAGKFVGRRKRQMLLNEGKEYLKTYSNPHIASDLIDNWYSRNSEGRIFQNHFQLPIEVVTMNVPVARGIFKVGGGIRNNWRTYHQKYPGSGGYFTFSRIGFDSTKTRALVYVIFACGGLCGNGDYFLLEKDKNTWKIKEKYPVWIS